MTARKADAHEAKAGCVEGFRLHWRVDVPGRHLGVPRRRVGRLRNTATHLVHPSGGTTRTSPPRGKAAHDILPPMSGDRLLGDPQDVSLVVGGAFVARRLASGGI